MDSKKTNQSDSETVRIRTVRQTIVRQSDIQTIRQSAIKIVRQSDGRIAVSQTDGGAVFQIVRTQDRQ